MDMAGYMTSFRNTRYHMNDFRGSRFASVAAGGKIQLHSCEAAKCHRKEVWGLERTLAYSERGVVLQEKEASYDNHFMLYIRKLLVAA